MLGDMYVQWLLEEIDTEIDEINRANGDYEIIIRHEIKKYAFEQALKEYRRIKEAKK